MSTTRTNPNNTKLINPRVYYPINPNNTKLANLKNILPNLQFYWKFSKKLTSPA